MTTPSISWAETGLEVTDISSGAVFANRVSRVHDMAAQMAGMARIARAFVEHPETLLQELVNTAIEFCGADSAGISIEKENPTDAEYFEWVATAGQFSGFLNAVLPRYPSACSVCLDRGRPQLFRVGQRFFDILGVEAPLVTDGILLPWEVENTRGTIFVIAHGRDEAFDEADCRLMQVLADFAAMGIRNQRQQRLVAEQAGAAAAAVMANDLAHSINNPLQSLTNLLYLASEGVNDEEAKGLAQQAFTDLQRLSLLVQKLLALPTQKPFSHSE